MNLGIYSTLRGVVLASVAALSISFNPLSADNARAGNAAPTQKMASDWKEFQATGGNCSMKFPCKPDHLSEKMRLPEEGFDLKYDAYVSSVDQKTVFLLLVAQYPDFVDESYARMSLEGFLNGILTHNPNNQLIFADLSLVGGHEALDFFIRTGGVYFKGRALMVKNSLYLMAMECEVQNYDETHFNTFIDSFQLAK